MPKILLQYQLECSTNRQNLLAIAKLVPGKTLEELLHYQAAEATKAGETYYCLNSSKEE
jgi:hypothetical protein